MGCLKRCQMESGCVHNAFNIYRTHIDLFVCVNNDDWPMPWDAKKVDIDWRWWIARHWLTMGQYVHPTPWFTTLLKTTHHQRQTWFRPIWTWILTSWSLVAPKYCLGRWLSVKVTLSLVWCYTSNQCSIYWALPPQGHGLSHWIQLLEVLPC
jgi:hypothetical protein